MNFVNILRKFGDEGPKTALVVVAINCVINATVRPLITLMNPNEAMERKRYAALRESLTEFVALPMVVGLGFVFKNKVAPAFFKGQTLEINRDTIRKIFTVVGLSTGDFMIPFATTALIGGVFKLFPKLKGSESQPLKGNIPTSAHPLQVNAVPNTTYPVRPPAGTVSLQAAYPLVNPYRTTTL